MAFKVLLVEDDNNLREIYEARLQAEGYNIVTARDGEEALGVAKTEIPDLVISDVMMPRVSGFEMLDILRNTDTLKDVKVIMLTALGQADDKTRANSLGADRYLVKSQVTLEDIVKTAHELLGDVVAETAAAPAAPPAASPVSQQPSVSPTLTFAPTAAPAAAPAPIAPMPASPPMTAPAVVPAPPAPTPAATMFSPTVSVSQPPVAPTPPIAAPAAPTPTAPSMPGAVLTPAPMAAPMPTPAPVTAAAPSTSEEIATMDTQIDDFVRTAPDTTPAADPNSPSTQDDAVLADAMHDLAATTEPVGDVSSAPSTSSEPAPAPVASEPSSATLPTQPAVPPAPVVPAMPMPVTPVAAPGLSGGTEDKPQPSNNNVIIANKKIIQPLSSTESKPSIHELAAREEANSAAASAMPSPAVTFSPVPPTPPMPPAAPSAAPEPQPPQAPPANPGGFDPNSISL